LTDFLGAAKFYRGLGLSPIPVNRSDKSPRLGTGYLETYSNRRPTDEELGQWFSNPDDDLGIGIITSENIVTIDVDDKVLWSLTSSKAPEDKAKETWVHSTPRGYRTFLKDPADIIKSKISAPFPGEHRGIELKPSGTGYVVAPPTEGYVALNNPLQSIQQLSEDEARILVNAIRLYAKIATLIDGLAKVWTPGKRHELAGPVAGALRKGGLKKEQTETVIDAICALAGDREKSDRDRYVDDTYEKPLDQVAGISKLKEILVGICGEDKAKDIVSAIPIYQRQRPQSREGKGPQEGGKVDEGKDPLAPYYMHPPLTDEELANLRPIADDMLRDPNLMSLLRRVLSIRIVGEDEAKLASYFVALTSCMEEQSDLVLGGASGTGKSHMAKHIVRLFPKVLDATRVTPAFFDRLKADLTGVIFYAVELPGLGNEGTGQVRVMMSEGSLSLFTVDSEQVPTIIKTRGTPVFFTSTVRSDIGEQLSTRTIFVSIDESEAQTRRIMERQSLLKAYPKLPEWTPDEMVLRAIPYALERLPVLIPFAEALCKLFPSDQPRARRDYEKLLKIIAAIAFLHQKQRTRINSGGKEHIVASLADAAYALRILTPEILKTTIYGLPRKAFNIYDILGGGKMLTKRAIRGFVPMGETTARRSLEALMERGLVVVDESKREYAYGRSEKKLTDVANLEMARLLSLFGEEQLKSWVVAISPSPFPPMEGTLNVPSTLWSDESEHDALCIRKLAARCGPTSFSVLDAEIDTEDVANLEMAPLVSDSSEQPRPEPQLPSQTVKGTVDKMQALLQLIDMLEAKSGLANLDELEGLAKKEYGIDSSDFGALIPRMLRESLIVETKDGQGVRRASTKPPPMSMTTDASAAQPSTPDAETVGPTCQDCKKHTTSDCIMEEPKLITDGALFARTCTAFEPKERLRT